MLRTLQKKYQELLSREKGLIRSSGPEEVRVCLAYPNLYRTGMSNLGFQTIYKLFNCLPGAYCDRVFLPDPPEEEELHRRGSALISLESCRPLRDFDILAFSVSFEGDYLNILKILSLGGIGLRRQERPQDAPLIMGGGVAVTMNPEPLADFFDLFLIGEGEELLPEFYHRYLELSKSSRREELLLTLQREVAGVYVPACYGAEGENPNPLAPLHPGLPPRISRRRLSDLDSCQTEECIETTCAQFGDMFLLEVNRGCGRGCRFCAAGFLYRPVRFRSRLALTDSLARGVEKKGKVGLIGTAVSDHPELLSICGDILEKGGQLGIGSLRIDRINADILQKLKAGGLETLALAPEAGTERLREVIRKGVTEAGIRRAVELLIEQAILNVRLYFMVGLPTETAADIQGIVELVRSIKQWAREFSAGTGGFRRITISVNQFIPKAATPFQWLPLADIASVKKKLKVIEQAFKRDPTVKIIHDPPRWNYIQALLSLGDRRVGELLLAAHRCHGRWPQAIRESGLNPDDYVYRRKSYDEALPWEIIDHGIERELLVKECDKALAGD